jgi:hypothetical protein
MQKLLLFILAVMVASVLGILLIKHTDSSKYRTVFLDTLQEVSGVERQRSSG